MTDDRLEPTTVAKRPGLVARIAAGALALVLVAVFLLAIAAYFHVLH